MNYNELKTAVSSVIKTNGNQEITGQILQNVLNNIISTMGANAQFVSIATPTTAPGTPDANVFYLAYQTGEYANFDIIITTPGLYALKNTSSGWSSTRIADMGMFSTYPFARNTITTRALSYSVFKAIKDILIISPAPLNKKLKVYVFDRLTNNFMWIADESNTTIWEIKIPNTAIGTTIIQASNANGIVKVKLDLDEVPIGTTYINGNSGGNDLWLDTAAIWSSVDTWIGGGNGLINNNWSAINSAYNYTDNDILALNAIKSLRLYNYGTKITNSNVQKALQAIRNVAGDYYIEFNYNDGSGWIYLIRYSSTTKPSGNIIVPLLYNETDPTGQYMAEMIVDFSALPDGFTWTSPNRSTVSRMKDDLTIIDNYKQGTGTDVIPVSQWALSAMIQNPSVEVIADKVRYNAGRNLPLLAAFAIKELVIVSEPDAERKTNYNVWIMITGGSAPYRFQIANDANTVIGSIDLGSSSADVTTIPKRFTLNLNNGAVLDCYVDWEELPDKTVIVNGGCGIRANKGYKKPFNKAEIETIVDNSVVARMSKKTGISPNYAPYNNVSMYVPNLWGYNPGHSAATDIQNGVQTVSTGVYNNPIVTKLARFEGMTNRVWQQYFNMKNAVGAGSIVAELLALQNLDDGEMLPALAKATFYNPGTVNIVARLGIIFWYDDNTYTTMYSSGATLQPGKSATVSATFTPKAGMTWNNITSINGYSDTLPITGITEDNPIWLEVGDMDFYFVDPKKRVTRPFVDPVQILPGITEAQLSDALQNKINDGTSGKSTIDKNLRICCAGSSVTWGTGFLQDSMLKYLIPMLQKGRTNFISPGDVIVANGNSAVMNGANDKLLFDNNAIKVSGQNATIDFDIEGNEISIAHAILRDNSAASLVDLYIDGILYDTISNFNNEPLGHEAKEFIAVNNQKEFPLGKPFTYNHVVKVNGVTQTVTLNKGTTMPSSGWAVARNIMETDGVVIVQHTLFSPTALSEGDVVTCEYDYGQEITYEKTTIGKDGNGVLESTYGRGYTPFDPANPVSAAFGSGLDFRETDERIIKKYTFTNNATRHVQLKIRGLDVRATGTGTPYFIFNFATSRILYFQNAGIGGWSSNKFNDANNSTAYVLRTWREIVDFQPDIIFYESTPNDDWDVGGYKLYTQYPNLTLAQLQNIRTMPNKRILYQSGTYNYLYEQWYGKIAAITKSTVTFTDDTLISSDPIPGDSVVIGSYYSDKKQQVARLVRSYDAATKTITFDRPINKRDFVYPDISYFVGKGIQVRDLAIYANSTVSLLGKLKGYGNTPTIGLVPNPAPNMKSRDLMAYQPYLDKLADNKEFADFYVGLWNVYDWQYSQRRNGTITIPASSLVSNPDGTKSVDLTGITKGNNFMDYQILVNDIDVTNRDAVVFTSYCLGVDRTLIGAALNDETVRGKQVWGNFYPTLVFLQNAPTSGNIVINYTTNLWSGDSCHVNGNSQQLFATGYAMFVN